MIGKDIECSIKQCHYFMSLTINEYNNKNINDAKYYARKALIHATVFETEGSYTPLDTELDLQNKMIDTMYAFQNFIIDSKIYSEYELCKFLQDECMRIMYSKRQRNY